MGAGNRSNQVAYRGRYDNGPEGAAGAPVGSGAEWIAPINTPWEQQPDINFRVRFLVERNGSLPFSYASGLGYSYNGGPFITITGGGAEPIRTVDTIHYVS